MKAKTLYGFLGGIALIAVAATEMRCATVNNAALENKATSSSEQKSDSNETDPDYKQYRDMFTSPEAYREWRDKKQLADGVYNCLTKTYLIYPVYCCCIGPLTGFVPSGLSIGKNESAKHAWDYISNLYGSIYSRKEEKLTFMDGLL